MIGDLVLALADENVGRPELRGLLSYLRSRYLRLAPGPAREATAADGRALARAVERVHLDANEIAAGAAVVRRYARVLLGRDEAAGRPECVAGCRERLLLVVDGAPRCALCDGEARPAGSDVNHAQAGARGRHR